MKLSNGIDPYVKSYWVREDDEAAVAAAAAELAAAEGAAAIAAAEATAAVAAAEIAAAALAASKGKPTDESAKLLKEVMKNKDRAKKAEDDLLAAQEALAGFKGVVGDLKLEDLKALVDSRRESERKQLEAQGKYEQILEQVKAQHTAEIEALRTENGSLKGDLDKARGTTEELTVGRVFGDSVFIRENSVLPPSIARKEFSSYCEIEDGGVVVYNKPRGAEGRAPLVDASGENKSFEIAIKELYEKHPDAKSLLKAKAKPGAGSSTDTTSRPTETRTAPALKGLDRIAAALKAASK